MTLCVEIMSMSDFRDRGTLKWISYKAMEFVVRKYLSRVRPLRGDTPIRPFFIVGSGRSGNTLLRRILNSNESVFIPPETYVLGELIKKYIKTPFLAWDKTVELVYSHLQNQPEFYTFNIQDMSKLIDNALGWQSNERNLSQLINEFYLYYRDQNGSTGNRWGDKTPINTFYLEEIMATFPDSQVIHMLRDPYDVVYSYLNANLYHDCTAAAQRWCDSMHAVEAFRQDYPGNLFEIAYEDLVTKPKSIVEEVCNFLSIDYDDKMLSYNARTGPLGDADVYSHHENVKKTIIADRIGRGKQGLSSHDLEAISAVINANGIHQNHYHILNL